MPVDEPKYKVGDSVKYNNPSSEDHGAVGVITSVFPLQDPLTFKYRVNWVEGSDFDSNEAENSLLPLVDTPTLTKESAADLAIYLSLDSVEDGRVQSWVEELKDYASS